MELYIIIAKIFGWAGCSIVAAYILAICANLYIGWIKDEKRDVLWAEFLGYPCYDHEDHVFVISLSFAIMASIVGCSSIWPLPIFIAIVMGGSYGIRDFYRFKTKMNKTL